MTPTKLNPIQKAVRALGSDWIGEQVVRLGDYDEVVITDERGKYFARQNNGQVIKVVNTIYAEPRFDMRVLVRRSRVQPNIWKIAEILEDYDEPISGGNIAYHHTQHEEGGPDRLNLDRKQIKQLSVRVSGAWEVSVFGAAVPTGTGIVFVDNETLDLSGEVVTTGAVYVSIEADDNGDLSLNAGTPFAAPNTGTYVNIATPDPGKYPIAYVLLHEGQTELIDNNIRPILSLPGAASGSSHTHVIAWGDIAGTLSDQTDLQAALDLKLEDAPIDGEIYGRQDGDWEIIPSSSGDAGHVHGLARWNGASSQTTFDLPDLAAYIESVMLNGLEEDPLVYSLSSDRSQIVLDTALASDTNVIAHYVLLNFEE